MNMKNVWTCLLLSLLYYKKMFSKCNFFKKTKIKKLFKIDGPRKNQGSKNIRFKYILPNRKEKVKKALQKKRAPLKY